MCFSLDFCLFTRTRRGILDKMLQERETADTADARGEHHRRPIPRIDPPKVIDLSRNREENFNIFKSQWHNYSILTRLSQEPEDYQVALLPYTIGDSCANVFETLSVPERTVKSVFEVLESHCVGDVNIVFQRFKFNSRNQDSGEDLDTYLTTLRQLAAKCNFKDLHDELIRDCIVLGLQCEDTRRRLLSTPDLTLEKAIPICRSEETARGTIRDIQRQSADIHKISKTGKQKVVKDSSSRFDAKIIQCKCCGRRHQCKKDLCPAYGKKCKICGKSNHFAIRCTKRERKANHVNEDTDSVESIDMVESEQLVYTIKKTKVFADMKIRASSKQVSFQVDTGSSVNILPITFMPKDAETINTAVILKSWTGNRIKPVGSARIVIENPSNSRKYRLIFIVVTENHTPIVGLRASEAMNLLTINNDTFTEAKVSEITVQSEVDIVSNFPSVFDDGIGSLPGEQHLVVDTEIKPNVNPVRKVPHSLVDDLKRDLNKMENDKVITKVFEPTQWESSLVTPKRKQCGKL